MRIKKWKLGILLPFWLAQCTNLYFSETMVTETTPDDGQLNVQCSTSVAVSFNEPMSKDTIFGNHDATTDCFGTIQISDDDFATCAPFNGDPLASDNDTKFIFYPNISLLSGSTYKIKVTNLVSSAEGKNMSSDYTQVIGFLVK
ncbi:MAG: Ig-like domain-containing protein [Spirochaetia bacterium]|nr:Ig-like domain-containing protein [Spirochaetia bacterium]